MSEKKGFLEKIFEKKESSCCGSKIVPKTEAQKNAEEKKGSCCCGPKIVPKTGALKNEDERKHHE